MDTNDCCGVAKSMGVSPQCLCAAAMVEHSYRTPLNFWTEDLLVCLSFGRFSLSGTIGCVQLHPKTARGCLSPLKKCHPNLYKMIDPPEDDNSLRIRLIKDCGFSLKVMAACIKVNEDPKCNKGQSTPCKDWIMLWWNPGKDAFRQRYNKRMKCALDNFRPSCK